MKQEINNNAELLLFVSTMTANDSYDAIRLSDKILVFSNSRTYRKQLKKYPNATHGKLNVFNHHFYRFI